MRGFFGDGATVPVCVTNSSIPAHGTQDDCCPARPRGPARSPGPRLLAGLGEEARALLTGWSRPRQGRSCSSELSSPAFPGPCGLSALPPEISSSSCYPANEADHGALTIAGTQEGPSQAGVRHIHQDRPDTGTDAPGSRHPSLSIRTTSARQSARQRLQATKGPSSVTILQSWIKQRRRQLMGPLPRPDPIAPGHAHRQTRCRAPSRSEQRHREPHPSPHLPRRAHWAPWRPEPSCRELSTNTQNMLT